uniref:Solute carrier family 25 (Mitochondrial carnitine/acylcarnitine transporter), member 20/29 n=1 Tax=Tetraselmis sp. GSL018 TaxID=582737 RepID=A0A061S4Y8_9CHLO|mmetsp:Transcript_849/g.2047  ORF Transcript_849/g.2047 Transcript_849/m.2047 type:complete len:337 (-) Transcript_849:223-1233(-)
MERLEHCEHARKKETSPLAHAFAGQLAGMAGLTVIHPIDTLKCRLQAASFCSQYSATRLAKEMMFSERWSNAYKGIGAPLCAFGVINAINFSVNALTLRSLKDFRNTHMQQDNLEQQPTTAEALFAGAMAGFCSSFVRGPAERVKTVLQANGAASWKNKGTLACARELVRRHGFVDGLFTGTGATIAREIPQMALYFLTYETVKSHSLQLFGEASGTAAIVVAGGSAGVLQWLATYPIDVVKTRIQAAPPRTYSGLLHCAADSVRREGPGVMWRGVGVAVVRAFPLHGTIFLTSEAALSLIARLQDPEGITLHIGRQQDKPAAIAHVPSTAAPDQG